MVDDTRIIVARLEERFDAFNKLVREEFASRREVFESFKADVLKNREDAKNDLAILNERVLTNQSLVQGRSGGMTDFRTTLLSIIALLIAMVALWARLR